jgi:hypothetical protein
LLNSSKLVINPHHGIPPDRNPDEIIGVDLPAFLLSKSDIPDPVRVADIPSASFLILLARWMALATQHSPLAT